MAGRRRPRAAAASRRPRRVAIAAGTRAALAALLEQPQYIVLRGWPEEAAALRVLAPGLRQVGAVELAAAIRAERQESDPWKTVRVLEDRHRLGILEGGQSSALRQVVADLAGAGECVLLSEVEITVAQARRVGLRTEGCDCLWADECGGGEDRRQRERRHPPRQRCAYRAVEWTPATLAVTADRKVRAAVGLVAGVLRGWAMQVAAGVADDDAWEALSAEERARAEAALPGLLEGHAAGFWEALRSGFSVAS